MVWHFCQIRFLQRDIFVRYVFYSVTFLSDTFSTVWHFCQICFLQCDILLRHFLQWDNVAWPLQSRRIKPIHGFTHGQSFRGRTRFATCQRKSHWTIPLEWNALCESCTLSLLWQDGLGRDIGFCRFNPGAMGNDGDKFGNLVLHPNGMWHAKFDRYYTKNTFGAKFVWIWQNVTQSGNRTYIY